MVWHSRKCLVFGDRQTLAAVSTLSHTVWSGASYWTSLRQFPPLCNRVNNTYLTEAVVGRIKTLKDVHTPCPKICEYGILQTNETAEYRLFILEDCSGPNLIIWVPKSGDPFQAVVMKRCVSGTRNREMAGWERLDLPLLALKMMEGAHEPRNKDGLWKLRKSRKQIPCWPLDFNPVRLMSDFWPTEL